MSKKKSHPVVLRADAAKRQPNWPTFQGRATIVGTTPSGKVTVYYDATLGSRALDCAQALLAQADAIAAFDAATFGTPVQTVNVILFALDGRTDGTGGADHGGCDFNTGGDIEVCVAYGRNDRVFALFEAELSECQMRGDLCGCSTGEALSRWCSILAPGSNNALADFTSVPTWAQGGYHNWVDQTEPTDGDYDSIGCGMAFLSWLQSKGKTLAQIAQVMVSLGDAGTLADLYTSLGFGAKTGAWPFFLSAVKALSATALQSDDPFGAIVNPPTPPTPPTRPGICGLIEAEIVAAQASGRTLLVALLEELAKRFGCG